MRSLILAGALLCTLAHPAAAQVFGNPKINLTVTPATAKIFRHDETGYKVQLGTGSAVLELLKNNPNEVLIEAEGYEPVRATFPREQKHPKTIAIPMPNRVVKITAVPYDAQILQNGTVKGRESAEILVPEGKSVTVELKKPGYRTITRTYYNMEGRDAPPVTEHFEMADRLVLVSAFPSGAQISVDGAPVGENSAEIAVPRGKCVAVIAGKPGLAPAERRYCNSEQAPPPPLTDALTLKDRLVVVRTTPATAGITVNGREVGTGQFSVVVPEGQCSEVLIAADGFVEVKKPYCNQDNMVAPPPEEHFQLLADESFSNSVQSDLANVNFTVEVGRGKTEEQAWKLISQIVMSHFDLLEITDRETGYLRTNWVVKNFPHRTVRTRFIVKLGDTQPLKYVVKIASERSRFGLTDVKANEDFEEWSRILNDYRYIIDEIQARLR
jgi:hypothetical protein